MTSRKSKVISVVRSLSDDEWSDVRRYILRISAEESDIFRLFDELRSRKSKLAKLDIEVLYQSEFSDLSRKSFYNLASRLYKEIEEHLVYQRFREEKFAYDLYKVKMLNDRQLYHLANLATNKMYNTVTRQDVVEIDGYEALTKAYNAQYFSNNPIKYDSKYGLQKKLLSSYLDAVQARVSHYHLSATHLSTLLVDDFDDEERSFSSLERILSRDIEVSKYFERIRGLMEVFNLQKADDLLADIKKYVQPGTETHGLLFMYLNSLTQRSAMKSGTTYFGKRLKEQYSYGMESHAMLKGGVIDMRKFCFVVEILAVTSELSLAIEFMENWIHTVVVDEPQSFECFLRALIHFHNDNYGEALEHLAGTDFEHETYKFRSKLLVLLCSFDRRAEDYVDYIRQVRTLRRYLNRHKHLLLEKTYIKSYNQLLLVRRLIKHDFEDVKLEDIDFGMLMHRTWSEKQLKKKGLM